MATVQHRDIPDAQLHEPKGVLTASQGQVYVANGGGSGAWAKVGSDVLKGLSGDGGLSGKKVISDGANGFIMRTDAAYGSMVITANTNAFAVTAAVDATLATTSDYTLFTGTGAPWGNENLFGVSFLTDRLIVPVTGIYEIHAWANISQYPSNTAKVAMRYRINASGAFSSRYPISKSNSAADAGNLNGFGLIPLNANDFIQLYFASTAGGGLIIQSMNTMLKLIRQTA